MNGASLTHPRIILHGTYGALEHGHPLLKRTVGQVSIWDQSRQEYREQIVCEKIDVEEIG